MNNKGYTITELLVVMLLSSLVAGVVFLTYGFINKNLASWKKNLYFEQEMEARVKVLDAKLRKMKSVQRVQGDTLYAVDRYGMERVIVITDGSWELKGDSGAEYVGYKVNISKNNRKMIVASGQRIGF